MDTLAGILELAGVYLVGNRSRWGFALCLGCNALWSIVAVKSGLSGLLGVSLVMAVVNTRNFHKWSRESVGTNPQPQTD